MKRKYVIDNNDLEEIMKAQFYNLLASIDSFDEHLKRLWVVTEVGVGLEYLIEYGPDQMHKELFSDFHKAVSRFNNI